MENTLIFKCSKCKCEFISNQRKGYCNPCMSEYAKQRYETKKEQLLNWQRNYIENNKDVVKARNNQYKAKNLDKCHNLTKKWKQENKAKVISLNGKRRANLRNAVPKWLTEDDFWMIEQAYELAQLRSKVFGFKWHVDHVIPLKGKNVCGLHTPYNLQVIPAKENLKKRNNFL